MTKVVQRKRRRIQISMFDPSLTVQADAAACDINNIMARYQKTGVIEHARSEQGRFGDFSGVSDYQTALNAVIAAQDLFDSLPSKLRSRFDNDPEKFLSFVDDPANAGELVKLGLVTPQVPSESPSGTSIPASQPGSSDSAGGAPAA